MATASIRLQTEPRSLVDNLRRALSKTAPALILLALTIAVFWKITLTNQYTWLNGGDLSEQVLPLINEEIAQWQHGRFPIWDPHQWGGQSLLGQEQPGVLFPLNWLLWSTPLWQGHLALQFANWYFVLIHYLAALFCYLLARDLDLSRFASICAGACFGLSGVMANIEWPQMLNGGMWAPLVLLYALRSLRGRRPAWSIAVAGSIAGFSFLGGHHQLPTYTLLSVAFLLVFYMLFRGLGPARAVLLGLTCLLFTFLIGAPQLLPGYEYWSRSLRWVSAAQPVGFHDRVPYIVFNSFSLDPGTILGLIVPATFPGVTPFVGLTILSFAALASATPRRLRMAPPFAALAIFGVLFSLGKFSVFHGILYSAVPLVDKSRTASFAIFITDLSLAVLAGMGIDLFLEQRDAIRALLRRFGQVLLATGGVLFLFLVIRGMFAQGKMLDFPAAAELGLSAVLLACVFFGWIHDRMPPRGAIVCVLGMILFEIGMVTTSNYPHIEMGWPYLAKLGAFDDIADFLRAQPGPFRVFDNGDDIPFNFGDWYGIDEYGGIGAGMTENIAVMNGSDGSFNLLGASYYLGRQPWRSDRAPVFQGRSGVNVYRVPGAFPRAWSVHQAVSRQDRSRRQEYLNLPLDRLESETFVLGPAPALARCADRDSVRITSMDATNLEIDADMACQGMVVAGNTFFPGWLARVDNSPATIYEAYGFLQGVVVPAGRHRIHFHYVPLSLYAGLACAAAGLAALALLHRFGLRS